MSGCVPDEGGLAGHVNSKCWDTLHGQDRLLLERSEAVRWNIGLDHSRFGFLTSQDLTMPRAELMRGIYSEPE